MARSRPTLLIVASAILIGLLAFGVKGFVNVIRYASQQRATSDLIDSLSSRRPNNVSPAKWETATTWTGIAVANVCYSPDHVSFAELGRFKSDLESKLEQDVDLETLDWIWHRLANTGPHGAQYVEKFEGIYRADTARSPTQE